MDRNPGEECWYFQQRRDQGNIQSRGHCWENISGLTKGKPWAKPSRGGAAGYLGVIKMYVEQRNALGEGRRAQVWGGPRMPPFAACLIYRQQETQWSFGRWQALWRNETGSTLENGWGKLSLPVNLISYQLICRNGPHTNAVTQTLQGWGFGGWGLEVGVGAGRWGSWGVFSCFFPHYWRCGFWQELLFTCTG